MRKLLCILAVLALTSCTTAQRYDAAGDVHALLVAIRDNDQQGFDARVDREALKREIEARMLAEARKSSGSSGHQALAALLAPALANLAGDALIQPAVFRTVAEYYGYKRSDPLPGPVAITGSLRKMDDGRMCATRKKDGPCLLVFTEEQGVWKLSGFTGDLSMLRTRP
jgi:hypothetical protein